MRVYNLFVKDADELRGIRERRFICYPKSTKIGKRLKIGDRVCVRNYYGEDGCWEAVVVAKKMVRDPSDCPLLMISAFYRDKIPFIMVCLASRGDEKSQR